MPCSALKLLRAAQACHAKPTGREDDDSGAKQYLSSFFLSALPAVSLTAAEPSILNILWNTMNTNVCEWTAERGAKRWTDGEEQEVFVI